MRPLSLSIVIALAVLGCDKGSPTAPSVVVNASQASDHIPITATLF